ncbi:Glyoxalase-like domain-containing protein [Halopelagius inordinatus]|uniref:Glyoxalase-like domain-containing protein n=1 Tax=Halopelagius inordinatus TaxID=553467 RepID=A0A1I2RCZ4_9EURY|nr:Glyoxalase-like domain-containing protein [Halopelagius inordinatus]
MIDIDHVAFGGRSLDELRDAAANVGLPTEYGGEHGTGTTEMAVVGLPDGAYLELLAPTLGTDPDDAGFWPAHLAADAGPAGWCLDVPRVADEAKRAIDAGVRVDGPREASRTRPDGARVEWDMCFEGEEGDERLPFVIADRTPRTYRVRPHPELAESPLSGVGSVVLAVSDRAATSDLLTRRHRLPSAVEAAGPFDEFDVLPGSPVALAAAGGDGDGLADRVSRVGQGPCAVLLEANDFDAAADRFALTDAEAFGPEGESRVAWFDDDAFRGRLGVVGR